MIQLKQTKTYERWEARLKDKRARTFIAARLMRLSAGLYGRKNGVTKMTERLTTYDPAAALVDDEEIAFFMADAFETGDANYIAKALGVVARAKGMTEIAQKTGLSREQLYRSFSERGNPTLKTTLAVMRALGIDMTAKPHATA
jgi:probable addiction module antidote protein